MKPCFRISGRDAIRLAERDALTLRDDEHDPAVVYVSVTQHEPSGWWNGTQFVSEMPGYNVADFFNTTNGEYLGPDEDGVEPRWDDAPSE